VTGTLRKTGGTKKTRKQETMTAAENDLKFEGCGVGNPALKITEPFLPATVAPKYVNREEFLSSLESIEQLCFPCRLF